MIPAVIHQTAKSTLSWEERRLCKRLRKLLPDWEYRFWDDRGNEQLIATHFSRYLRSYQKILKGVIRADIARYAYLYVYGGFYFDTDYKLVGTIDDNIRRFPVVVGIEELPRTLLDSSGKEVRLGLKFGNAIMGSFKGYPLWRNFICHIFESFPLHSLDEDDIVPHTGPRGLSNYYLANRGEYPEVTIFSQQVFYPDIALNKLWDRFDSETIGAHLCWGSWRHKNVGLRVRNEVRRKLNALV